MPFDYQEYYRKRKKEISEKRKHRYHTDPEYRQRVIETQQKSVRRRKPKSTDRRMIQDQKGQIFYSIGKVEEVTGLHKAAIRSLHNAGIIPIPTHFDGRGWRLYTPEQVQLIAKVLSNVKPALEKAGWRN